MELAAKAALLGCISAAGALLIKKSNPELALILSAAVVLCIVGTAVKLLGSIAEVISAAQAMAGLSAAVFEPVLKCMGIGITAKICADICRDASQSGVASAVETAGAAAAVFTALPLFKTLLNMIGGMI